MSILNKKNYIINNSILYIFDSTLKTNNNNPNNGWKIGEIVENDIYNYKLKENIPYSHLELIEEINKKNFNFTQPEKWGQIILHKMGIYKQQTELNTSGWFYEDTINGENRKDIIFKHFIKNGKYTIPIIFELKDKSNPSIDTSTQIKKYIEDIGTSESIEKNKIIEAITIIGDFKSLFFKPSKLNKLKHLFLEKNKFIKQTKKTFVLKNKKYEEVDSEKEKVELNGIVGVLPYFEKIKKEIPSSSNPKANKIKNEYLVFPKHLHYLSNDLNPRELLKEDSYIYFYNSLINIFENYKENNSELYDINDYGNEKMITCVDEPIELEGNVLIGFMSLSDGQRSSYAYYLLSKLFNKGDFKDDEKTYLEKMIKNFKYWETKNNRNLENFIIEFINPMKKTISDTSFTTKATITVSENIENSIRKSIAHNTHKPVEELDYLDFKNIIFIFNEKLWDMKIQINWPHISKVDGFTYIDIDRFFKIMNTNENAFETLLNRNKISKKTRIKILKKYEYNDSEKITLQKEIEALNQDIEKTFRVLEVEYSKENLNIEDLTQNGQNEVNDNLQKIKFKEKELEKIPKYISEDIEKNKKTQDKINQDIEIFSNIKKIIDNEKLSIDDAIDKVALQKICSDKKVNEERINIVSNIHSNLSKFVSSFNENNVQSILNPGFREIWGEILRHVITENNEIKKDENYIIQEIANLKEKLFKVYINIKILSKNKEVKLNKEKNFIKYLETNFISQIECIKCKTKHNINLLEEDVNKFQCD